MRAPSNEYSLEMSVLSRGSVVGVPGSLLLHGPVELAGIFGMQGPPQSLQAKKQDDF